VNGAKTDPTVKKATPKATRQRWFDAAYFGHAQTLRELCGSIDPNIIRSKGEGLTAVMLALEHGREEAVAFLAPISDMARVSVDGRDMLMHAAMGPSELGARLALPFCDAKRADASGLTALMMAAYSGHAGIVRLILQASDPSARTPEGRIALHLALEGASSDDQDRVDTVRLLLASSDWKARDPQGRSPLMMALEHRVPMPKVVDELACLQPRSRASQKALKRWGAQNLPKLFAQVEKRALCASVASAPQEPILSPGAIAADEGEGPSKAPTAKGPARL